METLIKEVIFIFHCRQYSSPVLFNVGTIEVSAAIGGDGGDDVVISVVAIGSIAGGSDDVVTIDAIATTA